MRGYTTVWSYPEHRDTFIIYHRRTRSRQQSIFARYGKNKRSLTVAIFHTRSFGKLIYVKPARIPFEPAVDAYSPAKQINVSSTLER